MHCAPQVLAAQENDGNKVLQQQILGPHTKKVWQRALKRLNASTARQGRLQHAGGTEQHSGRAASACPHKRGLCLHGLFGIGLILRERKCA